eukprot:5214581-Pleurochrysis_carterae.AAC.1
MNAASRCRCTVRNSTTVNRASRQQTLSNAGFPAHSRSPNGNPAGKTAGASRRDWRVSSLLLTGCSCRKSPQKMSWMPPNGSSARVVNGG